VNTGCCNGKDDEGSYFYCLDEHNFIDYDGDEYDDKFAAMERDSVMCLYYFLHSDPAKFFSGKGATDGDSDTQPAKKKCKLSEE
jgi:hypothetical protein